MMPQNLEAMSDILNNPWFWPLIIWSLIWKGIALWRAARNGDKIWYIVLLVINTLGLLEITYIFFFLKRREKAS